MTVDPLDTFDLLIDQLVSLVTGDLICVGGHQAWPSPPSAHAIASVTLCKSLIQNAIAVDMRVFFDDIGAAAACAGATCSIAAGGEAQSIVLPSMETWSKRYLHDIANALAWRQHIPAAAVDALRAVCAAIEERPPVCQRLLNLSHEKHRDDWVVTVEMLMYAAARKHFLPLQLIAAAGIEPVQVLFERAMSNAASRTLHKAFQRQVRTRVRRAREEGLTHYWADLPTSLGGPLLLRREQETGGAMTAANYCGALLAQLFFNLCRPKQAPSAATARTILYFIPCYDRVRVRQGMQAFFEVFCDLRHWFGLEQVTLISLWETGNPRVPYALDRLSAISDEAHPHYRPAFVKVGV